MTDCLIYIVLDAFRWDYLDPRTTPFLSGLCEKGLYVRKVRTASGFTQRTAIFAGTWADVSGNFTMHRFDPEGSPFRFLCGRRWPEFVGRMASRLPGVFGRVLDARLRNWVFEKARLEYRHPSPARIPIHLLPFFSVSEDQRPIQERGALSVPTLFDGLLDAKVPFLYLMYPEVDGTDERTEEALRREAARKEVRAYFALFSGADQAGHAFGPRAIETSHANTLLDRRVSRLDAAFREAGREPTWLIVGDHGMLEVTERVDVLSVVRNVAMRMGLTEGKDWIGFVDSTVARLWALRDRAAAVLDRAFVELAPWGSVLTEEMASARRIPFGDRRYGDRLWLADPGILICPDFFHRLDERVLGMHGYEPAVEGQKGFAVVHGPGVGAATIEDAPLVDVCPTFCDLVGIEAPGKNEGNSWVKGRVGVGG